MGLALFILKLLFDFALLLKGSAIFGQQSLLKYFLPLEIIYIIYNTAIGPLGLLGKFTWKP